MIPRNPTATCGDFSSQTKPKLFNILDVQVMEDTEPFTPRVPCKNSSEFQADKNSSFILLTQQILGILHQNSIIWKDGPVTLVL